MGVSQRTHALGRVASGPGHWALQGSLLLGAGTLPPVAGSLETRSLEGVRGMVTLPDLKCPEAKGHKDRGGNWENCSILCPRRWERCWNIPHLRTLKRKFLGCACFLGGDGTPAELLACSLPSENP